MLPPAKIMDTCIQAMNVRSLEKNTFGSILIGALRNLFNCWFVLLLKLITSRCDAVIIVKLLAVVPPSDWNKFHHGLLLPVVPVVVFVPLLVSWVIVTFPFFCCWCTNTRGANSDGSESIGGPSTTGPASVSVTALVVPTPW